MSYSVINLLSLTLAGLSLSGAALAETCVECHKKVTRGIVADWQLSKHAQKGIDCSACHGDAGRSRIPGPEVCGQCHPERLEQFKAARHALAWAAMEAMPTIHWQPMAMTEGRKAVEPATRSD
jgi:hydroxylamine dehydrogenase